MFSPVVRGDSTVVSPLGFYLEKIESVILPEYLQKCAKTAVEQIEIDLQFISGLPTFPEWLKNVSVNKEIGVFIIDLPQFNEVPRFMADMFSTGVLSFPWKRLQYTNAEIMTLMDNLRTFAPRTLTNQIVPFGIKFHSKNSKTHKPLFPLLFRGKYLSFLTSESDYFKMDVIVDLFQECARLSAYRIDEKISPLDKWRNPAFVSQVLEKVAKEEKKLNSHLLREAFYSLVKECTQFKPSLAVSIYRYFKAKRILDFSAGWGDRLIAAIAVESVGQYQGFDPNIDLIIGHNLIMQTFLEPDRKATFNITYLPFQESVLTPKHYDLVFTSPPFFNLEIYSTSASQSTSEFPVFESWITGFLFVSLGKAWEALNDHGHLVIHISDFASIKVCEKMCLWIQWKLAGANYLGVICSTGGVSDRARPIWVFEKNPDTADAEMVVQAEKSMKLLYPEIWNIVAKN